MKRAIAAIVLSVAILLTGCSQTTASSEISEPSSGTTLSVDDGMFTSRDMEIGYDAVSYTHLDVYKRQVIYCAYSIYTKLL